MPQREELGCSHTEEEGEELGCDKCKKKRRIMQMQGRQNASLEEARPEKRATCPVCSRGKGSLWMGGARAYVQCGLGQQCPIGVTGRISNEGMNCQHTSNGDIICSNNVIYGGTCPHAPEVNYAGVAEDRNGFPVAPPAPAPGQAAGGATTGGTGISSTVAAVGGLGLLTLALILFK